MFFGGRWLFFPFLMAQWHSLCLRSPSHNPAGFSRKSQVLLIKFPRSMSVMRVADAGNGGSKGAKDVEFGAAYFGSQLLQGSSEVSNVVQGIKEQTTCNAENHWLRCSVISQGGLCRRIPPPAFVQSIYVRSCRNPHSRLADSNPTSMFQNDCIYTIMLTSLTFIYLCNR